jgi:hypothetical protein
MEESKSASRVAALKGIKNVAEQMASDGVDAFEIRQFINEEKKKVSYQYPEHGEYAKSKKTAEEYRRQVGTDPINDLV